jgi:hypothetical protein
MPGDHPHQCPTAPVLIRFLAPGHFLLRPQLLTRISAVPRAKRSRRLPAPLRRLRAAIEDLRPSAGSCARNVPHIKVSGHICMISHGSAAFGKAEEIKTE